MMPLTFVMVCEAQADFHTAATLADRVLCERIEWIEVAVIDSYRRYRGASDAAPYLIWAHVKSAAQSLGRRVHGHFDGRPGDLDALAARKAIQVALTQFADAKAIFLIRDSDKLTARTAGLNQAREEMHAATPAIVIGVAHCKREAWHLAGFEARQAAEQQLLDDLRQELGFHPCERSHELAAKHDHDKQSAKRVLSLLVGADRDREMECTAATSLALLKDRGRENGLGDYLTEIEVRITPLFTR